MKRMKIGKFAVHSITNTSVHIGRTKVTKAQIQRLLKLMANQQKVKFPVGSKVKVVREIGDSRNVLGLTGTIVKSATGYSSPLCQFEGFIGGGHGESNNQWYVQDTALELVR